MSFPSWEEARVEQDDTAPAAALLAALESWVHAEPSPFRRRLTRMAYDTTPGGHGGFVCSAFVLETMRPLRVVHGRGPTLLEAIAKCVAQLEQLEPRS